MSHVKVTGLVDKPLGDKGFILLETIKLNDGRTYDKKWKVWTTPIPAFSATVEAVGEVSVKVNEYIGFDGTTKHAADLNINNATINVIAPPVEASPDVNGDWATPTQVAPF